MELTQSEKITLVVMLDEKIKEWAQLVHNFSGLEDVFDTQELRTIKNKINESL